MTFPFKLSSCILKGKFLPQATTVSKNYVGSDTEKLYKKNLSIQPDTWYYKNNNIEYNLNKHKYRTTEFDKIDWANSIVIFGCSNVFGLGLHTEDTVSNQLSELTNLNVVNMGAPASSMKYSLYNSVILANKYPTPIMVVQLWTSIDRMVHFNRYDINHEGSWNTNEHSYLNNTQNAICNSILDNMTSKNLWSTRTKYYDCTFFKHTHETIGCDYVKPVDFARDLHHPGRQSMKNIAELIAKKL
jgi:hypothetical protein